MLSIDGETKSCLKNPNQGGWSRDQLIEEAKKRDLSFAANITKAQLCKLLSSASPRRGAPSSPRSPSADKKKENKEGSLPKVPKSPKSSLPKEKKGLTKEGVLSIVEEIATRVYDNQKLLVDEIKQATVESELSKAQLLVRVQTDLDQDLEIAKLKLNIKAEQKKTFTSKDKLIGYYKQMVEHYEKKSKNITPTVQTAKKLGETEASTEALLRYYKFISDLNNEIYRRLKV